MDPLAANPFGLLTFIVAPAILTNASSVMALGTTNRFTRAIDRVRALSSFVEGKENDPDPENALRIRQLKVAERRVLLLVRALTAFYLSVGSFAATSLASLIAAAFFLAQHEVMHQATMTLAFCAGVAGIGGLVAGSALLVWESRLAFHILREETSFLLKHSPGNQETR